MIWWRKNKPGKLDVSNAPVVHSLPDHIDRVFAIGDVHGLKDLASKAEARIAADPDFSPETSLILYMGDLVDRGPDSAFLLDWLLISSKTGASRMFLRGNHEAMMAAYLDSPTDHPNWLDFGGYETLNSYGVLERPEKLRRMKDKEISQLLNTTVPESHRRFLSQMVDAVDSEHFFFAHAGVVPDVPLASQTKDDLLWARDRFMAHTGGFEKTIVHGHTPVPQAKHENGRVSLDTGAYMTGNLTVAKIAPIDKTVDFIVVTATDD